MTDEEVNEKIEQLDEYHAKVMLKVIYGCIETAKTGSGGDEMTRECVDKIFNFYQRIPEIKNDSVRKVLGETDALVEQEVKFLTKRYLL